MKKIFVKIDENDGSIRWENWYSEEDAVTDHIYIGGGNRDFSTMNKNLYTATDADLANVYYDLDVLRGEGYTGQELVEEVYKVIRGYFKYHDGTTLIPPDCLKLLQLIGEYAHCGSHGELEIMADVLSVIYKEKFITGVFHGYGQGDWQTYLCPESLKPKLDYIEAVYMGTGTLLEISDDKYETAEEAEEANNYFLDYVADLYNDDDIKQYVADQLGITKAEVEIIKE